MGAVEGNRGEKGGQWEVTVKSRGGPRRKTGPSAGGAGSEEETSLTRHKVVQFLALLGHHVCGARLAGALQPDDNALSSRQRRGRHAHHSRHLGRHAHVPEETLVPRPEGAPGHAALAAQAAAARARAGRGGAGRRALVRLRLRAGKEGCVSQRSTQRQRSRQRASLSLWRSPETLSKGLHPHTIPPSGGPRKPSPKGYTPTQSLPLAVPGNPLQTPTYRHNFSLSLPLPVLLLLLTCSSAYMNSRKSWFHILEAFSYWAGIFPSKGVSTVSNSAPEGQGSEGRGRLASSPPGGWSPQSRTRRLHRERSAERGAQRGQRAYAPACLPASVQARADSAAPTCEAERASQVHALRLHAHRHQLPNTLTLP